MKSSRGPAYSSSATASKSMTPVSRGWRWSATSRAAVVEAQATRNDVFGDIRQRLIVRVGVSAQPSERGGQADTELDADHSARLGDDGAGRCEEPVRRLQPGQRELEVALQREGERGVGIGECVEEFRRAGVA